jgi:hypothetical protein
MYAFIINVLNKDIFTPTKNISVLSTTPIHEAVLKQDLMKQFPKLFSPTPEKNGLKRKLIDENDTENMCDNVRNVVVQSSDTKEEKSTPSNLFSARSKSKSPSLCGKSTKQKRCQKFNSPHTALNKKVNTALRNYLATLNDELQNISTDKSTVDSIDIRIDTLTYVNPEFHTNPILLEYENDIDNVVIKSNESNNEESKEPTDAASKIVVTHGKLSYIMDTNNKEQVQIPDDVILDNNVCVTNTCPISSTSSDEHSTHKTQGKSKTPGGCGSFFVKFFKWLFSRKAKPQTKSFSSE